MGKKHLGEMQQAGMVPSAVCELDPARLEVAEEDFPGIQTYTSVDDMLSKSDVELVTIITPHDTHARLALQCLQAGRHVVCEKPMAITTSECDEMINEARKRELVLSTYHNRHWDGCILQAVREIGAGAIGEVYRADITMGAHRAPRDWWRDSRSISGGILYDWGVHLLEYTLQIMRGKILEVSGFARQGHWAAQSPWKEDANEDEAAAVVRLDGNRWINLSITSLDPDPRTELIRFHGTDGSYVLNQQTYQVITPGPDGEVLVRRGKNPKGESWQYYANVAQHLAGEEDLVITPEWSRRPIHILDLAVRSAKEEKALKAAHA
jgi:predicted dehydrogenase